MVILDLASRIRPDVRVFTLDTGRLPAETIRMIEMVQLPFPVGPSVGPHLGPGCLGGVVLYAR